MVIIGNSNPSSQGSAPTESDLALDTLARRIQESLALGRWNKFWETQPVRQFREHVDACADGPIEHPTSSSKVKQEPSDLPKLYEWITCDIESDEMCSEVYQFLSHQYVEDYESMFRLNYSKAFLIWALRPPHYLKSLHIGIRVKKSQELVAFISGIPARVRVREDILTVAEINFLCVHKNLRSKRLAPLLIMEMNRRVKLENVWQAAYTAATFLPTPISTSQFWHRHLNPKKLIDIGFHTLDTWMTMSQTIKLYRLPESTATPGFRKMEQHDVPAVTRLLENYLSQFIAAHVFDESDVDHWLVPKDNVVVTYVVESPETNEITDFCSFFIIPSSILGNINYSTFKAAYSYFNVSTKIPLIQLVNDALIVAKSQGCDVFNALDVMNNSSFFKELQFRPGDGKLHYYIYNYRIRQILKPSELGLVFF